jgi:hypothetical protein
MTLSLNILATTPDEMLKGLTQTSQSQPIDIKDDGKASALASLSTFLSHRPGETEGHLLRPVTPTEHRAVEALLANPVTYGIEDLIPHLLNGAWYSGEIMSRMAVKLTRWSMTTTASSRWVFLGPDILNGITAGYSMTWARNKLTQAISEDTQYICFLCNTGNHWYLVVTDLASGSINIFNSLAECGNALVSNTIKPLKRRFNSFQWQWCPWKECFTNCKTQHFHQAVCSYWPYASLPPPATRSPRIFSTTFVTCKMMALLSTQVAMAPIVNAVIAALTGLTLGL